MSSGYLSGSGDDHDFVQEQSLRVVATEVGGDGSDASRRGRHVERGGVWSERNGARAALRCNRDQLGNGATDDPVAYVLYGNTRPWGPTTLTRKFH